MAVEVDEPLERLEVGLGEEIALGVPRLDDDFRGPVSSPVPTLFVSGSLDGDTPERNTRATP